jgi:hypothetical protein
VGQQGHLEEERDERDEDDLAAPSSAMMPSSLPT